MMALVFMAGIVVGAICMGTFDAYQIAKDDEVKAETISNMQGRIHDLEEQKDTLSEMNSRLRETIARREQD